MFDAGADVFTSGTYSWVAYGSNGLANVSIDGNPTLAITRNDTNDGAYLYLKGDTDLTTDCIIGKRYRLRYQIKYAGGSAPAVPRVVAGSGNEVDSTDAVTTSLAYSTIDFTPTITNPYFHVRASTSNVITIDNLSLIQLGAVAEYDGSGVTNDKWYDKSGNQLHGTVSGATDENTAGAPWISANHPAFNVYPASNQNNIAIDSDVAVAFGSERFDQDNNFASNAFTAPTTGKYQLQVNLRLQSLDTDATHYQVKIVTSNQTYDALFDPDFGQDAVYWNPSLTILADMDECDTASVTMRQSGAAQQADVATESWFSGFLVCQAKQPI